MKAMFGALVLGVVAVSWAVPTEAHAQSPFGDLAKKAGQAGKGELEKRINAKLLAEGKKNQCSFKSGTDVLAPGCDQKLRNLAGQLIEAKKQLDSSGARAYKFVVSGHTDSVGNAAKNKALSEKRAAVIVKEMVARGVPRSEIIAEGRGSEQMLEKPDNTEAKRAKNRRYEIQVRL